MASSHGPITTALLVPGAIRYGVALKQQPEIAPLLAAIVAEREKPILGSARVTEEPTPPHATSRTASRRPHVPQRNGRWRTFNATITRVDGQSFQIAERPDVWLNLSKFNDPPPAIPSPGTFASITIDAAGYVRAATAVAAPEQLPLVAPATKHQSSTRSTRAAVLEAAAHFLASKPEATNDDVLALATAWERWVDGPGD